MSPEHVSHSLQTPSGQCSKREGRVNSYSQAALPTTHYRNRLSLAIPMSHAAGAPESWGSKFDSGRLASQGLQEWVPSRALAQTAPMASLC